MREQYIGYLLGPVTTELIAAIARQRSVGLNVGRLTKLGKQPYAALLSSIYMMILAVPHCSIL